MPTPAPADPILDDWHPVADDVPAEPFTTRLLGRRVRVRFDSGGVPAVAETGPGGERALPVRRRFGCVWTSLGRPAGDLFDIAEAAEPDRRFVRCGWVTLRASAPRVVENFLDMAHFPFVHTGVLGAEPWTEVPRYRAEVRRDTGELWATDCRFFQPRVAATEAATGERGEDARLTYRVPMPFTVMLYRVCPSAPDRLDAILLALQPMDELLCRAQPVMYLVDDRSAHNELLTFEQTIFLQDRFIVENQIPARLPLDPGAEIPTRADTASMAYRRWLRDRRIGYGTLLAADPAGARA